MGKEHSIFISYRQIDGSDLAAWIYQKLLGKSMAINKERILLAPYIDKAIPGGYDWKKYLCDKLENAGCLLIVCSPQTMNKYEDRDDYFYHEIEWWIKYRKHCPPILVSTEEYGYQNVPKIILQAWNNIQVAKLNSHTLIDTESEKSIRNAEIFLDSITIGISGPLETIGSIGLNVNILPPKFNLDGVFAWEKDRHGKYIYANELYARAGGCDSPSDMLGKTDFQMAWHSLADKFREGDRKIMYEDELLRLDGVFEKEIMAEKVADIFVKEGVLKDQSGRIIGVTGCFMDVTAGLADLFTSKYQIDQFGLYLGQEFGHQHLDTTEIYVLRGILNTLSKDKIASNLNKNVAEIKSVINSLKQKFQCTTEQQVLIAAIRAGVPLQLFG